MTVMEAQDAVSRAYETLMRRVVAGTARKVQPQDVVAGIDVAASSPATMQVLMSELVDLARHATIEPDRPLSARDLAERRLAWSVANRLYDEVRLVPGVTSRR